ncbi:MAG: hypothetical protein Q8K72_00305 [Acidimicrobiales bacterium]|nr:hypothetical protein [Acidimicrobiales bacterium]
MPDVLLELPAGDIGPLLHHLERAVFINFSPGVDAVHAPPRTALANLVGNQGPYVPLATWTPGEIGIQHAAGQRVTVTLAAHGCPVPDDWYRVSEHPKRGLVLRTYETPAEDVLRWLASASEELCRLPITLPWPAVVRTR